MTRGCKAAAAVLAGLSLAGCGLIVDTTPTPDRSGLDQAAWALQEAIGRQLTVVVPMGGRDCDRFAGVDVTETSEAVEIRAWVEHDDDRGCFAALALHHVTVDLKAPLGQRHLDGCLLEQGHPLYADRATCADIPAAARPAR